MQENIDRNFPNEMIYPDKGLLFYWSWNMFDQW
jgi:hypothetical protein